MRSLLKLSIITMCWLSLYSCNNANTNQVKTESTLEKIIRTKELHVGYFIFEPTIMKNPRNDSLQGVFIDMIVNIAKSLGPDVKIVYHQTKLSTFHTELNTRQYDLCIGATFATPKRAAVVSFSSPLFFCGYTGVAKKTDAHKYRSWGSIDNSAVKISVLQGSAIADLVKKDFRNQKNITSYPGADLTIPLAAVSSDQANVGLMNQITVFTYLKSHPELVEVMGDMPLATTYFSWAVRHNDIEWLNYINTCIDYMTYTGEMYKYEKKYSIPLMHKKDEFFYPNGKI